MERRKPLHTNNCDTTTCVCVCVCVLSSTCSIVHIAPIVVVGSAVVVAVVEYCLGMA